MESSTSAAGPAASINAPAEIISRFICGDRKRTRQLHHEAFYLKRSILNGPTLRYGYPLWRDQEVIKDTKDAPLW